MPLAPDSNAAKIPFAACPAASCLLYHVDPIVWLYVAIASSACWQPAGGPLGWSREGTGEGEGGEVVAGALVDSVGSGVDDDTVGLGGDGVGSGVGPLPGRAYARKATRAATTVASEPTAVQLISLELLRRFRGTCGGPRAAAGARGAVQGQVAWHVSLARGSVPAGSRGAGWRRPRCRRRG